MANRDGLITNDKFCLSQFGKLKLRWWHRPMRLRSGTLLEKKQYPGGSYGSETHNDIDSGMDDSSANPHEERRAASLGSGLSMPSEMERGTNPMLEIPGGES